MKKQTTVEIATKIIEPAIEELGFELVDVEYIKEGPEWYLRVYIDHDNGIDLNACEKVSRKVDFLLEEYDQGNNLFPGSYILEVSSPGITRPLKKDKDLQRSLEQLVTVKTYGPINGRKEFTGILKGFAKTEIVLATDNETHTIPRDKISLIHLAIPFN